MTINQDIVRRTIARAMPAVAASKARAPKEPISPRRIAVRGAIMAADGVVPSRLDRERMMGENDLVDLNYFERGLNAARSVCRIILRDQNGREIGCATGAMVSPRLLLTNHHVFEQAAWAANAIAEFDYQLDVLGVPRSTVRFGFRPSEYFYASEELDFAIAAVDPRPLGGRRQLAEFGWLRLNPEPGKINPGEYVSIVQHPSGEPKQLSIRENELVKIDDTTLLYMCDTAPGSSGSPVFNDLWQVVALHHSGVPATDEHGNWLGPDGKPAPPNPSENQVKWIANEGIRVSSIAAAIETLAPRSALREELIELMRRPKPPVPPEAESTLAGADGAAQRTVKRAGNGIIVTVPVELFVSLAPAREGEPILIAAGPQIQTALPAPADIEAEEKMVLDPVYKKRRGYDVNFLGVPVPLPELTPEAMTLVSRDKTRPDAADSHLLHYYHFSIVMNSARRLCFFTAGNLDSTPARHGKLSRKKLGKDVWIFDPRVPREHQVGNAELYENNALDRGHVVRREDNYWGETEEEATFANWDTFHYTNCTPQHEAFNQSQEHGLWGQLENHITDQGGTKGYRVSIFGGPVFGKRDRVYNGVAVPKQFWKVIVAEREEGGLTAFAFLLSQAKLVQDMEAEFDPGEFRPFQVPVAKLEAITEVRFPREVHDADVMGGQDRESMHEVARLEEMRWSKAAGARA